MDRDRSIALALQGICFGYLDEPILKDFTLELESRKIHSVVGPNGSGKTTLLKMLAGLLLPKEGRALYRGQDLRRMSLHQRASRVAYIGSELVSEFPLTVREVVGLGGTPQFLGLRSRDTLSSRVEAALRRCRCESFAERPLSQLSGGERQRVFVAQALMTGAKVILFDESFSKMDLDLQIQMGGLLKELVHDDGYTFVWVSHDINYAARWSDLMVVLKEGEVLEQGHPRNVLTSELLGKLYPGVALTLENGLVLPSEGPEAH